MVHCLVLTNTLVTVGIQEKLSVYWRTSSIGTGPGSLYERPVNNRLGLGTA